MPWGTSRRIDGIAWWRAVVGSRTARSALVGAGLGAVALLLTALPWQRLLPCDPQQGWSCLGWALLLAPVAALLVFLASWLALRLAGVRPAWRVAAAAVVLCWLQFELEARAGAWSLPDGVLPLADAVLFATAAALTAPGPLLRWPRVVLLVVLALLWPLSALVGGHRADDRARNELTDVGVPLYAPDVTGYRMRPPLTSKPGSWFGFLLLPDRQGVDPDDLNRWAIRVTVEPVPPAFRPPVCDATSLGSTVRAEGCEQVAPGTWRRANPYVVFYFVRRDDYLIVMSADGKENTEADLRKLASTLSVRTPDYFLR
ncbi:hypothetical protein ACGF13_08320 [Kitasatospora sp. NPDC048286]|uniref:hypothetical protein n=1 Tax=Kitasatospora sp. NPDC048286 TaxID=3364047 RepID=UPI00371F8C67